ncbi:50S ribosomal protein L6 [Candidatus Dependentiae bacterium]|nr:50S ribosomal protein L6 [Candidatus Dependentiae bacterium]MBU4387594.1 50S ribosomal protein L6 [Candidatus Dependentiae bacterium]MCG2756284.1 50S ribosomal protein L6 [Candidatus Dependentiae bacterium]
MSKIGRKPIELLAAKIELKGQELIISGSKAKFTHVLPNILSAKIEDGYLYINLLKDSNENRAVWGLNRALVANKIFGCQKLFEKKVTIVGLGFKAQLSGKKMTLTLGYSHKIDYVIPNDVEVDIDKTGQLLVFKSTDKLSLGNVCDKIKSFRFPEPYKGTGIIVEGDILIRKAGKAKASA